MFISLTYNNYSRSNGRRFNLRADLVERVSDGYRGGSVITLITGTYYNVKEPKDAVSLMVSMALGKIGNV